MLRRNSSLINRGPHGSLQWRPASSAHRSATFSRGTYTSLTFTISFDAVEALLSFPVCVPSGTCAPYDTSMHFLAFFSWNLWFWQLGAETWAPPTSPKTKDQEPFRGQGLSSCDPWAKGHRNQLMLAGPGETKFTAHIALKREQRIKTKDQKWCLIWQIASFIFPHV